MLAAVSTDIAGGIIIAVLIVIVKLVLLLSRSFREAAGCNLKTFYPG